MGLFYYNLQHIPLKKREVPGSYSPEKYQGGNYQNSLCMSSSSGPGNPKPKLAAQSGEGSGAVQSLAGTCCSRVAHYCHLGAVPLNCDGRFMKTHLERA